MSSRKRRVRESNAELGCQYSAGLLDCCNRMAWSYFSNISLTGPPAACRGRRRSFELQPGSQHLSVGWRQTTSPCAGQGRHIHRAPAVRLTDDGGGCTSTVYSCSISGWSRRTRHPASSPNLDTPCRGRRIFPQRQRAGHAVVAAVPPLTTSTPVFQRSPTPIDRRGSIRFYPARLQVRSRPQRVRPTRVRRCRPCIPGLGINWTSTPGALGVNTIRGRVPRRAEQRTSQPPTMQVSHQRPRHSRPPSIARRRPRTVTYQRPEQAASVA
jgi:hypothetical protein